MAYSEEDLFKLSRSLLSFIGLDPLNYGAVFKITGPLILCATAILSTLLFQTFLHAQGGMEFLAISVISVTIYYQVSIHLSMFAANAARESF